jgi:DNA-binding beta-propeller fold protein YncE
MAALGCSKTNNNGQKPPAPGLGHGDIQSVQPLAQSSSFYAPRDGAPSPDGSTVFFIASVQEGAAVFKMATSGGDAQKLASGDPLVMPFGLAVGVNGQRIYVVDSAVDAKNQHGIGAIFSLSADGGPLTELSAARGTDPRSLEIADANGVDMLYFTGIDPMSKQPAVFKMTGDGSNLQIVLKGSPLGDPTGIAVATNGNLYVADASPDDSSTAGVIKIANGAASMIANGMRFGHPAGIALVQDESALFVSGLDLVKGSAVVFHLDLSSNQVTTFTQGIDMNHDSAGLHRARNADVYAWANAAGETKGESFKPGGTVYLLKGKTAP